VDHRVAEETAMASELLESLERNGVDPVLGSMMADFETARALQGYLFARWGYVPPMPDSKLFEGMLRDVANGCP
jgi:hypothetical protein